MVEQLVTRLELGRLPFKRRPMVEPGTALVFQMANGQLVAPEYPYTTGETWWRGPKAAYVVDLGKHDARFECELPSSAGAVYFAAAVSYKWSVHDAARVVSERVTDPEAECRAYLERWLPTVTGRFTPDRTRDAVNDIQRELGRGSIELDRGIRFADLNVQLRMDEDQAVLAKELEIGWLRHEINKRDARGEGEIASIKEERYSAAIARGREGLMAVVLAQDPSKGPEVLNTMINLSEREEQRTLEAIKVLIDGGEIRLGELDGAVQAAVQRLSGILGKPVGQLGAASTADPDRILPPPVDDGRGADDEWKDEPR